MYMVFGFILVLYNNWNAIIIILNSSILNDTFYWILFLSNFPSRSYQISIPQGPEETLGSRFAVLGERPGCTSKPGWPAIPNHRLEIKPQARSLLETPLQEILINQNPLSLHFTLVSFQNGFTFLDSIYLDFTNIFNENFIQKISK